MWKILRYTFYDLVRSRWLFMYMGLFLVITLGFIYLSGDSSQMVLSLMNVVLVLVPLVATVFGVTFYYNSREFTLLLLAQPVPRRQIFLGQLCGLASSLALCLILGTLIPALIAGIAVSSDFLSFITVVAVGVILTFVFTGLAIWVALANDNRIRGFGFAVLMWLVFAVIYDGLFLLVLSYFSDYPLDNLAIALSMLNPIDLGRILITLQMDIAALMGYTGAVFRKTIGSGLGQVFAWAVLVVWAILPVLMVRRLSGRKDF